MSDQLIFAADTIVRFKSGRILIHTTSSSLPAFESENPMLVGWLCQFARPTSLQPALASLQSGDRNAVTQIVDYLQRSGALVLVDDGRAKDISIDDSSAQSKSHLRLLARSIYDVACDILGLGPFAEREMQRRTGIGVERRLLALLAATDSLRSELGKLREEHIADQLRALGIDATSRELKLHIGCGKGHLEGWINIDVHPAPLAMNVLRGLPFANGSARYIFVSHLLEHLYFPRDVQPFLAELHRVLMPGGIVRIVVPDIESCIEAYTQNDPSFFASRRETWPWWPADPTPLEDFLGYAGAGPEPGYLFESHKYGYDFATLAKVLKAGGFDAIVKSSYMASKHNSLQVDNISAVAKAQYGGRYYSLFVEASK